MYVYTSFYIVPIFCCVTYIKSCKYFWDILYHILCNFQLRADYWDLWWMWVLRLDTLSLHTEDRIDCFPICRQGPSWKCIYSKRQFQMRNIKFMCDGRTAVTNLNFKSDWLFSLFRGFVAKKILNKNGRSTTNPEVGRCPWISGPYN